MASTRRVLLQAVRIWPTSCSERKSTTLRIVLPRAVSWLFMEKNFYEQDPRLPVAAVSAEEHLFEAVSPSMRSVEAVIPELAHSSVPVLLIGERGAGKRTIAKRIHQSSGRSAQQFCVMSCAGLLPPAIALEASRPAATLYLDEIGDLNPECQKRLLELLSKPGVSGWAQPAVHVICGSSRDLETEVRDGRIREDLYYRLSGVCLRIPPLRQRKEDVPHLMTFFLTKYSEIFRRPVPPLSAETQQLFLDYAWPGNLHELEAAARAIVAVGDESVAMGGLRSLLTRSGNGQNAGKVSLKAASRAASREAEKELILKVLTRTRWNRRRAAQELQISYKALLYKLKQIGYGEEYGAT
jgi:two-component system response regulator AtoC